MTTAPTGSPAVPSLREVPTASEPAVAAESLPVIGYAIRESDQFMWTPPASRPFAKAWRAVVYESDAQAQINELTAELANAIQGRTEAHHWGDIFENRIKALTSERDEVRSLERQLSEQMDAVSNELTTHRTAHDALRQELAGAYELLHATEDKFTALRNSQPGTDELMALADEYAGRASASTDFHHRGRWDWVEQANKRDAAREALRAGLARLEAV